MKRPIRLPLPALLVPALLLATAPLGAEPGKPAAEPGRKRSEARVVREERTVAVRGVAETWRLEWRSAPASACGPEGEPAVDWTTCPCAGFEFGESGELDLVRLRPGQGEERLPLAPLFVDGETPAPGAVLPRWPVRKGDEDAAEKTGFATSVKKRATVPVMKVADYDHDGQATEFVLQVSSGPCGHRPSIVVGVDARNPRLHAFSAVEDPSSPFVLERPSDWERVREARGRVRIIQYACGDHGTEEEETATVWTDAKGLHATRSTKACP